MNREKGWWKTCSNAVLLRKEIERLNNPMVQAGIKGGTVNGKRMQMMLRMAKALEQALDTIDACGSINMEEARALVAEHKANWRQP